MWLCAGACAQELRILLRIRGSALSFQFGFYYPLFAAAWYLEVALQEKPGCQGRFAAMQMKITPNIQWGIVDHAVARHSVYKLGFRTLSLLATTQLRPGFLKP